MNFQSLMNMASQLAKTDNPQRAMLNMLNPQQKNLLNNMRQTPLTEESAQQIADKLNEIGITREQLVQLMNIRK